MFRTATEAREALAEHFEEAEPGVVEAFVAALRPAVAFETDEEEGSCVLGFLPPLPEGIRWPERSEAVGRRVLAEHPKAGDGIYATRAFPMQFVGTFDCAEIAALTDEPLPAEGALLFFYDLTLGPWLDGPDVCRVLHIQEDGEFRPEPPAFAEAVEAERKLALERPDEFGLGRERLLELVPVFVHPIEGLRPVPALVLPPPGAPEASPALDDGDGWEAHGVAKDETPFDTGLHMLGPPMPEQDDPRLGLEGGAAAWVLLLQVGVAEWTGDDLMEGAVSFLIRREELAAARFDRVHAVYQQT